MKNEQKNLPGLSRRSFLAASAAAPALAALARSASAAPPIPAPAASGPATAPIAKKYPIGLELYSVRTELTRDPFNTLRNIAKIGYEIVEFFAPYMDWSIPFTKNIKNLMDDLNIRCYSTHNHIESFTPGNPMSKAIELNQILGSRLMVLATAPNNTTSLNDWKKLCGQLTTGVDLLKPHGLTAGFHNHQTEWVKLDGDQRIMDILAANTPKEFVLQFDVGTCMEAGADPIAWIKANPSRIRVVHLKDWAPGTRAQEKGYRVLFGEGISPWKEICAAVEDTGGVEYYLMEQEGSRFPEFETAQRCLDNWKALRNKH